MSYHKSLAGVGWVSIVPSGTYPDPVVIMEIDSVELTTNDDTADLEDQDGYTIDSFVSKTSIEGTITTKAFSNSLLAQVTRGVTTAVGQTVGYSQTATVPSTPFQVTVTNSATFVTDLGVIDLTTGLPMTCAATATGTGVYAVSAGVYTFNTADATHSVLIHYRSTIATGTTSDIAVASSSAVNKVGLHMYGTRGGKNYGLYVPAAMLYGLSAKLNKGQWSDTSFKFKATLDASNKLLYSYGIE